VKKINSFVLAKIESINDDEVELQTVVDAKPRSFVVTFTKDVEGNDLGFIFRSDLEMLCRANDLVFVRSLMRFLKNYRNGQDISLPVSLYSKSKNLQVV
jgi:hypothetical protein